MASGQRRHSGFLRFISSSVAYYLLCRQFSNMTHLKQKKRRGRKRRKEGDREDEMSLLFNVQSSNVHIKNIITRNV